MRSRLAWIPIMALGFAISTPAMAQQSLAVEESTISRDVVDRMPVQPGATFTTDVGRLFCWTRITGAEGQTSVHHVWFLEDEEMADVELNVGAASWRTHSSKAIQAEWSGNWRVEVRDPEGTVLETIRFSVQ